MSKREIVYRSAAERDFGVAVAWYAAQAGRAVADRFIDRVLAAEDKNVDFPELGSTSFAHLVRPLELRAMSVSGFPYLLFYMATVDTIDVIRILHTSSDIPEHLRAPDVCGGV